jgi:hypothetical protein
VCATRCRGYCARRRRRSRVRTGAKSRRIDESRGSRSTALCASGNTGATCRRGCTGRTCASPERATRRFAARADGVDTRNGKPHGADGTCTDSVVTFRACAGTGNATCGRSSNTRCNQRDEPRCSPCGGISTGTCCAGAKCASDVRPDSFAGTHGAARCSACAASTSDIDGTRNADCDSGTGSESIAATGRPAHCTGVGTACTQLIGRATTDDGADDVRIDDAARRHPGGTGGKVVGCARRAERRGTTASGNAAATRGGLGACAIADAGRSARRKRAWLAEHGDAGTEHGTADCAGIRFVVCGAATAGSAPGSTELERTNGYGTGGAGRTARAVATVHPRADCSRAVVRAGGPRCAAATGRACVDRSCGDCRHCTQHVGARG